MSRQPVCSGILANGEPACGRLSVPLLAATAIPPSSRRWRDANGPALVRRSEPSWRGWAPAALTVRTRRPLGPAVWAWRLRPTQILRRAQARRRCGSGVLSHHGVGLEPPPRSHPRNFSAALSRRLCPPLPRRPSPSSPLPAGRTSLEPWRQHTGSKILFPAGCASRRSFLSVYCSI